MRKFKRIRVCPVIGKYTGIGEFPHAEIQADRVIFALGNTQKKVYIRKLKVRKYTFFSEFPHAEIQADL